MTDTKRVSREPTPEMCRAVCVRAINADGIELWLDQIRDYWQVAFDVAPSEPDEALALLRALVASADTAGDWPDQEARTAWCDRNAAAFAAARAYLAAQDQPQYEKLLAGKRTRDNPLPRLSAPVGADHAQHAFGRDAGNVAESECNPVGHRIAHPPATATPAAEPDVERRIRELVTVDLQFLRYSADGQAIANALRTYGEECRNQERERCAKICESRAPLGYRDDGSEQWFAHQNACVSCAAAIREARHD